jgi:NAD(P)-dependent dehydrogenase (short-subunit alcohol dehydrogenase family)
MTKWFITGISRGLGQALAEATLARAHHQHYFRRGARAHGGFRSLRGH